MDILLLIISAVLQAVGMALTKRSADIQSLPDKHKRFIIMAVAMMLFGVGGALYAFSLAVLKLSMVQPVLSATTFVATAVISVVYFKEKLGLKHVAGMTAILSGIVLVIN